MLNAFVEEVRGWGGGGVRRGDFQIFKLIE